jgi:hypothetical protein
MQHDASEPLGRHRSMSSSSLALATRCALDLSSGGVAGHPRCFSTRESAILWLGLVYA